MADNKIEGVIITPLSRIPDERGAILHMLRNDEPSFQKFGETYGSLVHPGSIKAWHLHKTMTLNYVVPFGKIKLVLYDMRDNSPTKGKLMELFLGRDNYVRVTIPPGIANGFKGIGTKDSLVINITTHPYDPEEISRIDPFTKDIPYNWDIKHG